MARRRSQAPAPQVEPAVETEVEEEAPAAYLTLDPGEDIMAERVTDDAVLLIATTAGRKFAVSPAGEVTQIFPEVD